jgi:hypothetical protein
MQKGQGKKYIKVLGNLSVPILVGNVIGFFF